LSVPLQPRFQLFETLRWSPAGGVFLRERHFDRLAASARYFGFPFDRKAAEAAVETAVAGLGPQRRRLRLFLARDGVLSTDASPLPPVPRVWTVALALEPIDERDPLLFHKTTHRALYDRARRDHPGADEVLLWNRRGELTESTRANLAVRLDGRWVTPALDCGLLPGTLREALLARGRLREAIVRVEDLARADRFLLFNSLRGVIRVERYRYTRRRPGAENGGGIIPSRVGTGGTVIGSPGRAGGDDPGPRVR
jgi:para-aminobenzoate synthetase/4-amino-4-deoxychorismate lyase